MTSGKYDRLLDDRPSGKIEDTIEGLIREIEKSEIKLADLRNLYEQLRSKIICEHSWQRYIRDRLHRKQQSVLPNTEEK